MDQIMDQIGSFLYNEVFGRQETHKKAFEWADFMEIYSECAKGNKNVKGAMLGVERKGKRYDVAVMMMNADGKPIQDGANFYIGRQITADTIGDDVLEFLNGERMKAWKPF